MSHKIPLEKRITDLEARVRVVEQALEVGRKPSEVNSLATWTDEEVLDAMKGVEPGRPDRFPFKPRKRGGVIIPKHQPDWAKVATAALERALKASYLGITVMIDETEVAYTVTWTCDNVRIITANEYIGIPEGLYQLPEGMVL